MIDRDRDSGEEIVHELGLDPAEDIDSNQRAELLREWHKQDAERDAEKHEGKKPHKSG